MRFPVLRGLIKRRILVNYRVDPEVIKRALPERFEPKLIRGKAVAGVCLIRLEQIRPNWMLPQFGISSENAAHRIAVCWKDEQGQVQEGVYIPRRDSGSPLNTLVGGRLFPGEHHLSKFDVKDDGSSIDFSAEAKDKSLSIKLRAHAADVMPTGSIFGSLDEASDFFKYGSLGYSETAAHDHLDGIILSVKEWKVLPLTVDSISSSHFGNTSLFPKGSIEFDCALIMRDVEHEWHAAEDLPIAPPLCSK